MADKVTLKTFSSLQNDTSATTDLNSNSTNLISAINNTLSRDGTQPNTMGANLDMNSNHIINLPAPVSNFDAVRLLDVTTIGGGGSISVNPLPVGGTTGQVLAKNSNTNFDAGWTAVVTGVNVTSGKTLSVTNTLTLSGTDGTTFTFPTTSDSLVGLNSTQTLQNKSLNTSSGNVISINGTALTGVTGAGSVVLSTSPTLISPTITTGFTATNLVTNADLVQSPAVTLKGNPTNAISNATDFTINSLTTLGAPDATNDYLVIWDHTAGTLKKVNPTAISGAAVAGVASIAGNTGVFLLGPGLTNTGNTLIANPLYHRSYLAGFITSAPGGAQILTITPGVAASDDNSTLMSQGATYTKNYATAWAVGSGNGSWDGTGSFSGSQWWHVFIIQRLDTVVVDVLTSLSAGSPTMPTNYSVKRRIGSFKTDGSNNIIGYSQNGDEFLWLAVAADDIGGPLGTTATLYTMNVPTGVNVNALFNAQISNASVATSVLFTSPNASVAVANSPAGNASLITQVSNVLTAGSFNVRTNASAQIRAVSNVASTSIHGGAYGWIDPRGKLA